MIYFMKENDQQYWKIIHIAMLLKCRITYILFTTFTAKDLIYVMLGPGECEAGLLYIEYFQVNCERFEMKGYSTGKVN